jgi:hypothetical protein
VKFPLSFTGLHAARTLAVMLSSHHAASRKVPPS